MTTLSAKNARVEKPCAVIFFAESNSDFAVAIALRCVQEGLHVYIISGEQSHLNNALAKLQSGGDAITSIKLDCTNDADVGTLFSRINRDGRQPTLVVHGGGQYLRQSALETPVFDIEQQWRSICLAGLVIGQNAVRSLLTAKQGTLLFLGHSAALNNADGGAAFAAASAGLRSLAQSMAREFGPQGIHIAHLLLAGAEESQRPQPDDVAAVCWQLHQQHKTTWTQELDLHNANFPKKREEVA